MYHKKEVAVKQATSFNQNPGIILPHHSTPNDNQGNLS